MFSQKVVVKRVQVVESWSHVRSNPDKFFRKELWSYISQTGWISSAAWVLLSGLGRFPFKERIFGEVTVDAGALRLLDPEVNYDDHGRMVDSVL